MLSSSPSGSISIASSKARSITRLAYPISVKKSQRTTFDFLQRRHYADEAATTQSEPVADEATEAQHGNNSIAASANADADANAPTSAENAEERQAASEVESATAEATEHASTATDSVKAAAQTAGEAIAGATQSLSDAAGIGSQTSEDGTDDSKLSKVVYVGNLFFDTKADDIKAEFAKAGQVEDVRIITDMRGLSKGFVTFSPVFYIYASSLPSLILYLFDTDSAISHIRPPKTPNAPSICSI